MFGRSTDAFTGGRGGGRNFLDFSELNFLASADKESAGNVVAHETLEGYLSVLQNIDYQSAHEQASKSFPALTAVDDSFVVSSRNAIGDVQTSTMQITIGSKGLFTKS